ncbi:MAG TPA: inositol monophosphatase family protein [Bacillota bacterium]|nr:inositol monophosphatase family protein [Bacillota bacterium]
MTHEDFEHVYEYAKQWVLEAGALIRDKIDTPMTINTKSNPKDLVTTMDKETERFFVQRIKEQFPDHLLLTEEGYGDDIVSMDGTVWIIDPIDGTMNFVHQKSNFAISVAIYHNGIGQIGLIYNVMDDILYSARKNSGAFKNDTKLAKLKNDVTLEQSLLGLNHYWLCANHLVDERVMQDLVRTVRGVRTYGSAALEFAYVAEGIIDGYLTMNLSPWDIAAGVVLVNEVGGITTTITGDSLDMLKKNSIVACNSCIHPKLIDDFLKKGQK